MQFTSGLITLVLAAAGVRALPGSVETRQSGLITAEFFADSGCDTAVLETDSYGVEGDVGLCFAAGVANGASTLITNNAATNTRKSFLSHKVFQIP
jgi:hypothetical protein